LLGDKSRPGRDENEFRVSSVRIPKTWKFVTYSKIRFVYMIVVARYTNLNVLFRCVYSNGHHKQMLLIDFTS
jgi:hypothetical protein